MTADEWKAASGPLYLRLILLQDKAQDCGLTEAEKDEYTQLQAETGALLHRFLTESSTKEKT
jgi:hypothetical protein